MTIDDSVVVDIPKFRNSRCLPESYRFASSLLTPTSHYLNIALTSSHWQLKDLLASTTYSSIYDDYTYNNDPYIYFPYKSRIFSFKSSNFLIDSEQNNNNNNNIDKNSYNNNINSINNINNNNIHIKPINYSSIKFQCNPRCLKTLDDIVVVGGINNSSSVDNNPIGLHKGAFSIYNNETKITENIQIGEFINNSVSINKLNNSNNHYISYLCNNDKHLYKFDLTPSKIIQSSNPIYLKVALNHSILSNDNNTLITIGDSSKIFISHPQEKNPNSINYNDFKIIQTNRDCGFSTSFLPNNEYQFITCFQDGLALIYDLRNLNLPIHSISSTRPKTQPGAFRVIKTSKNNDDLICISEHQGRIHLIDSRNFNNHSVLLLPKYLYNVPPTISELNNNNNNNNYNDTDNDNNDTDNDIDNDNENDTYNYNYNNVSKIFGKYPIAMSTLNDNKFKQWYNQPIIKDIDDFKDISNFGGELNLGYLESYRYFDSRYTNFNMNNNNNNNNNNNSNDLNDLNDTINPYSMLLQGSLDREDILKRKMKSGLTPKMSKLLTYGQNSLAPIQMRKNINKDGDEIRKLTKFWWTEENVDYREIWPWGKKVVCNSNNNNDNNNNNYGIDDIKVMETPERDPFFYIDSDIEINGMEIMNKNGKSCLCIGTKEGIIFWDINDWKRRCFPSFEYV